MLHNFDKRRTLKKNKIYISLNTSHPFSKGIWKSKFSFDWLYAIFSQLKANYISSKIEQKFCKNTVSLLGSNRLQNKLIVCLTANIKLLIHTFFPAISSFLPCKKLKDADPDPRYVVSLKEYVLF